VVDLQHQALAPAVESIDHREPPEWVAPVERPLGEGGVEPVQLIRPAGRRQGRLFEMAIELELRVFDQHWMVEPQGDPLEARPELGKFVQPGGHVTAKVVHRHRDRHPAGTPRRPQDGQGHRMHGLQGRLQGEKPGVHATQAAHEVYQMYHSSQNSTDTEPA